MSKNLKFYLTAYVVSMAISIPILALVTGSLVYAVFMMGTLLTVQTVIFVNYFPVYRDDE